MEALLHSQLPLNIIYGEPLKTGAMDLIDAHVDEPCEKSNLHMEDCCKSRTDVFGGSDRFPFVYSGLKKTCMYFPATHFCHLDILSKAKQLHVDNLQKLYRVDLLRC